MNGEKKRSELLQQRQQRREAMLGNTRPVAFGFINDVETQCNETWSAIVQRPFRGSLLWVWGQRATLHGIAIGHEQQLISPLAFSTWPQPLRPEEFLLCCACGSESPAPPRRELRGEHVRDGRGYDPSFYQLPSLLMPSLAIGGQLSFRYDGNVRGVVLVGVELVD